MKLKFKFSKKNIALLSIALGALFFAGSYTVSYFYNREKIHEANAEIENEKQSIVLKDSYKIVLTKRTVDDDIIVENNFDVKTIKKELDVRELNVEQVVELYKQKGYSVSSTDDYQMIFERAVGTLEPNKYYIGDKDGYIAIYKSDVNGIPVIENEDDITQREVSLLMEIDQNMIRNYEMVFDTKEECEEALSNFIS
ncbi:hypothetical protein [Sarcina ventriculi]|uniref:Bypass of forespore C C-terminal domain-containing protein n=1 Tax=Sarcina ventriculi TaxID=1267 RepID=A0ABP2AQZ9_SARVE|nr:hypothetical protein [Sarcina ventriculi]MBU5321501.1 hypothetical protein [Sarcina ventriculi]CUN98396.1 Uncharacterised protein [Sarcina ventriculi]